MLTPTSRSVVLLLALARPALAQAQAQPGPNRPPVVLFWSSPGPADAAARTALFPAVERAARRGKGVSADLSPAAPALQPVAEQVTRAIAAYDGMRFGDAVIELDKAAVFAAEQGARGLTRDALMDLFLYRALARTESGDTAAAWNDFVRAATIDPTRLLDPARFRPSALKSFARAVDDVKRRGAIALTVAAPAGSKIHIDGRPTGRDRVSEPLPPGEHYLWVERPSSAPFARLVTLASATEVVVAEEAAQPPGDRELARRAARLGSGPLLVVALRRDGGVGVIELRSIGPRGSTLREMVRLTPSPEGSARDLESAVLRALGAMRGELVGASGQPTDGAARAPSERWYKNRWVWLAVGVVATAAALSPFVFDSSGEPSPTDAALDPSGLE